MEPRNVRTTRLLAKSTSFLNEWPRGLLDDRPG